MAHRRDEGEDTPAWAQQILDEIVEIRTVQTTMGGDHALMKQTLGAPSEDGKAGTGLVGAVAEMRGKLDGLMSLKAHGVGLVAGVFLVVVIVVFGFKGALAAFVGGLK